MKYALSIIMCLTLTFYACYKSKDLSTKKSESVQCDFLSGNYNATQRISGHEKLSQKKLPNRDTDKDGIKDRADNCYLIYNPDQIDSDGDGIGDACDDYSDIDKDGIKDEIDNCPFNSNSNQSDLDGDLIGDICDEDYNKWVIYLDFFGGVYNGGYWNSGGIVYTNSGLGQTEISNIILQVKKDFENFPILITTDSAIYFSTNPLKRQKVIITQSNEWYCACAGGVAYINSIKWGLDVPAFVFSKLLEYRQKYIWEACSHEIGHTLGLNHQSKYDANCNFLSEYNDGGESSSAPIMGISYYKTGVWWVGATSFGCNYIQNDTLNIRNLLGY